MEDDIVLVYITDNNYIMPTTVSITSVLMNKKQSTKYNINIIATDVIDYINILDNIKSVTKDDNVNINIIKTENKYKNIINNNNKVTNAALLKFSIADILSNYNKVLYLDSDTIILNDLSDLFFTDISEKYAGVIKDLYAMKHDQEHINLGIEKYFNSGVMLLNTKILRYENISKKLIEYKLNSKSHYVDQNSFNYIFNNKVKFLSPKYNYITSNFIYTKEEVENFFETNINYDDIDIVHFSNKPWNANMQNEYFFEKFWNYYQYTSYYKNDPMFAINQIVEQKVRSMEIKIYNELHNVYNYLDSNKEYINHTTNIINNINNEINITNNKINKIIDHIAWFIPIKKWRNNFKNKF